MTASRAETPTAPRHDRASGGVALLIIDMINGFDFEGAEQLKPAATKAAGAILALRADAEAAGCPVIHVNDNFGEWHSDKDRIVARAMETDREITPRLKPGDADYFVLKPQFSGFYATSLPVLLPKLGVSRLILTGVATDICILFTAADAHMRDYSLWIPEDCVAAEDPARGRWALSVMRETMNAETRPTGALALADWLKR
ncbi:cysteine hydrolase [Sphingomonas oligophenolica]|uniref:Isochorismatase family cysteine hydrolase n=1 Tax=Sphingomonas oligophenolica TaxID=301154 RepID=A0ABU9Y0I4_9SPHN